MLEDMSFKDGEVYNAKLMPTSRDDVLPDRKCCIIPGKAAPNQVLLGSKPE